VTAGGLKGIDTPGLEAIVTTPLTLVRLPSTSLPVTVTVNEPPRAYAWVAVVPVALAPSPKLHVVVPRFDQASSGEREKFRVWPIAPALGIEGDPSGGPDASKPAASAM